MRQRALLNRYRVEIGRRSPVKLTTIENSINKRLGITPSLLTTFPLTPANVQSLVFDDEPVFLNLAPTAKWIVVLFFRVRYRGLLIGRAH
jgi:hypothetical protein